MILTPDKITRTIKLGNLIVGGRFPVLVETMFRSSPINPEGFLKEYSMLEQAGADILRVAINNQDEILAYQKVSRFLTIPIIADIHRDFQLGVEAAKSDFAMIRVNPGNTSTTGLKEIARASTDYGAAIRIGINTGSLVLRNKAIKQEIEREILKTINIFETYNQQNIMISAKDANVLPNIAINENISELTDYPLHIGLTEAGLGWAGIIKSTISISNLLIKGIGNTIRVSLTDGPLSEVEVGKIILRNTFKNLQGPNLISCPGCSRSRINVLKIASVVEKLLKESRIEATIAVMGCEINGPGEAKTADFALFGSPEGLLVSRRGVLEGVKTEEEALEWLKLILLRKYQ